jgi:hypothetical protein
LFDWVADYESSESIAQPVDVEVEMKANACPGDVIKYSGKLAGT